MLDPTAISSLLDKVLNTKVQRKAKTIIMTVVQFVLTTTFIIMNAAEQAETQNKSISQGLKLMTGISIAYVVGLAIFLLIHALTRGGAVYQANPEVEDAYAKTNQVPVFDGILGEDTQFCFLLYLLPYSSLLTNFVVRHVNIQYNL